MHSEGKITKLIFDGVEMPVISMTRHTELRDVTTIYEANKIVADYLGMAPHAWDTVNEAVYYYETIDGVHTEKKITFMSLDALLPVWYQYHAEVSQILPLTMGTRSRVYSSLFCVPEKFSGSFHVVFKASLFRTARAIKFELPKIKALVVEEEQS